MKNKGLCVVLAATLALTTGITGLPTGAVAATATTINIATALAAVNSATTVAQMRTALEEPALGLNLMYYKWNAEEVRVQIVQAVLVNRTTPFADIYELQQSFNSRTSEIQWTYLMLQATLGYAAGDDSQHVTKDLNLATTTLSTPCVWTTDQPAYIDLQTGHVTRPTAGNVTAHLQVLMGSGGNAVYRTFELTLLQVGVVIPFEQCNTAQTAAEFREGFAALSIDQGDFPLWPVEEQDIFANMMIAKRPAAGWDSVDDIWYTSMGTQWDATQAYSDQLDYNEVQLSFIGTDTIDHVTGPYIYWTEMTRNRAYPRYTSDHPDIIEPSANVGYVHRPQAGNPPVVVRITATFGSQTKTWDLTVMPL